MDRKSKIVKDIILSECKIWKEAYPASEEALDKFANKIIFELQYRVRDPPRAKGGKDGKE